MKRKKTKRNDGIEKKYWKFETVRKCKLYLLPIIISSRFPCRFVCTYAAALLWFLISIEILLLPEKINWTRKNVQFAWFILNICFILKWKKNNWKKGVGITNRVQNRCDSMNWIAVILRRIFSRKRHLWSSHPATTCTFDRLWMGLGRLHRPCSIWIPI